MNACAFESYLTQIAQLTRAQCMRVLALLKPAVEQGRTAAVIEDAVALRLCCPRCQGKQLYRHGTKSGLQRFRCRACGRTFNSLTGTPLARLRHKEKWLDFGDCMLDSRTVRKAAARVEDVNGYHSRFHKWLRGFNGVATHYLPTTLGGVGQLTRKVFVRRRHCSGLLSGSSILKGDSAYQYGVAEFSVPRRR
jgi:transposase-like protein